MSKTLSLNLVALFVLGILTYSIKQKVVELDSELRFVQKEIAHHQEAIHILKAEWAYLTRPVRLQALVEDHLELKCADGLSLVGYDDIFDKFDPDLIEENDAVFEDLILTEKPAYVSKSKAQ